MDLLHIMRAFRCVVQAGSLTGAAERLDTTTASISRMLSRLEAHLHIRLLNRTTRRIALTEAGRRYLTRCQLILDLVETAESEVRQLTGSEAGAQFTGASGRPSRPATGCQRAL